MEVQIKRLQKEIIRDEEFIYGLEAMNNEDQFGITFVHIGEVLQSIINMVASK